MQAKIISVKNTIIKIIVVVVFLWRDWSFRVVIGKYTVEIYIYRSSVLLTTTNPIKPATGTNYLSQILSHEVNLTPTKFTVTEEHK